MTRSARVIASLPYGNPPTQWFSRGDAEKPATFRHRHWADIGASGSIRRLIDLVERAAVGEEGFLCFHPTAEGLVNGKQLQRRKIGAVFFENLDVARTIMPLADHILRRL